jgi:hypothetical protein
MANILVCREERIKESKAIDSWTGLLCYTRVKLSLRPARFRTTRFALRDILQRSRLCHENRYSRDIQPGEQPHITACKCDLYKREP